MREAIPPLPEHVFMAWCLVKHRDNFTFTFRKLNCSRGHRLTKLFCLFFASSFLHLVACKNEQDSEHPYNNGNSCQLRLLAISNPRGNKLNKRTSRERYRTS
jgi:hypothetical protein